MNRITTTVSILIVLAPLVILAIAPVAVAAPIVDGRYVEGEGYTHLFSVGGSEGRKGIPGDPGTLWAAQDADNNDLYLAFILPKTYVDNTYGANSIGWRRRRPHRFRDLFNSDRMELELGTADGGQLDVVFDYLARAPGGYGSGLIGDGKIKEGPDTAVVAAMTSLDFNLRLDGGSAYRFKSPATDSDYTANAAIPDWEFNVIYEMQFDGGFIGGPVLTWEGFADGFEMEVKDLHASPSKSGDYRDAPPEYIPEPATLALLAFGGGIALIRRKRTA